LAPLMGGTPEHPTDLSGSYYPQEPNDLSGGLPINLDSLRDGPPGSKPFYPYSTLIRCVGFFLEICCVWWLIVVYKLDTPSKDLQTKNCSLKISIMPSSLECVEIKHETFHILTQFAFVVPLLQSCPCWLESTLAPSFVQYLGADQKFNRILSATTSR
jgi:hypothetical protein